MQKARSHIQKAANSHKAKKGANWAAEYLKRNGM
jgi:hypothetical protein